MKIIKHIATIWRNTNNMPFLFRSILRFVMVAAPILLFLFVFPIAELEMNGYPVSYADLWASGEAAANSMLLAFAATGAWGFAARNRMSRWLLVSAPIVPHVVLVFFPASVSEPIGPDLIVSTILVIIVFYFCLFHLRVVREYLDEVVDPSRSRISNNNFRAARFMLLLLGSFLIFGIALLLTMPMLEAWVSPRCANASTIFCYASVAILQYWQYVTFLIILCMAVLADRFFEKRDLVKSSA